MNALMREWVQPREVVLSAFVGVGQNGPHAADSTQYPVPWLSSILLRSIYHLQTYFATCLRSLFPTRMHTPRRKRLLFLSIVAPAFCPKLGHYLATQWEFNKYQLVNKWIPHSGEGRGNQSLAKSSVFQLCFLVINLYFFTFFRLLGEIVVFLHGPQGSVDFHF